MKRRLLQFYDSFGDRGVMFILYALAFVMNAIPAVFAEMLSVYPDEINVAGVAALYSGRDWSGLLLRTGSVSGYVQALFYTPLFWVLKNPYALYKSMLIVNALLVSFIPLIVYHLAGKFGVMRVRRKLLIAFCCGMYVSYITNSKFIWNEPLTCLLGWLLVLSLFSAWDKSNRGSRAMSSVLVGFMCALAYASNKRLISVVAAVILTVIFARLVLREKILNLPVFALSVTVSFFAEHFTRISVDSALSGGASAETEISMGAAGRFFGVFFSHIYAFMTSTIGMGSLAAAIFAVMLFTYLCEGIKSRPRALEDGTKVYEAVKHKYSTRLTVFALFQFLAAGCTSIISAFFTFGTGRYSQEAALFGRYTDNIAPFAVFLVLVYIFTYGIDLVKLFIGAGIYGYACICFAVAGYPLAQLSSQLNYSPIFGLFPSIFGNDTVESASGMSYIVMSSLVFTLYALVIVFISCTRRHRTALVTGAVFGVLMTGTLYAEFFHVPRTFRQSSEKLEPCKNVIRMLYNDSQSPPIVTYEIDEEYAAALQFLMPDTRVSVLDGDGKVPEACLLVAASDAGVPFEGGTYDVVGRTDDFAIYAYGESARDFIRYSSASDRNSGTVSSV